MPVISLQNLKKIYKLGDNTVNALRGVSLDIEEGEFVTMLGPSGSGKTTMANVMANEMQVGFHQIMATRIKNWNDFYQILKGINANDVIFIDEIHALAPKIQEQLYGVMEDFVCTLEDKNLQKQIQVRVPRFTLIGATTHTGELNAPLLSRFQYKGHLMPYTTLELTNMVMLTEEVGEVARIMSRRYGEQSEKESDQNKDLGDELADVMFVLICLANQTGINLEEALKKNLVKKTNRDKDRHLNNPKLK